MFLFWLSNKRIKSLDSRDGFIQNFQYKIYCFQILFFLLLIKILTFDFWIEASSFNYKVNVIIEVVYVYIVELPSH